MVNIFIDSKAKTLAEIIRDIGQVFFASMFVGPLVSGIIVWPVIISGLILSLLSWILSLSLTK